MAMDLEKQLHATQATGWKAGLYDDIQATWRAPIVNWVFRTTTANHPEAMAYVWSQLKPLFTTAAFAELTVERRDALLAAVEDDLPVYRKENLDLAPAEFAELKGQVATFDIVSPRLAVLFEAGDRAMNHDGEGLGTDPATDRTATAPYPDWLDADRGRAPTMADYAEAPDAIADTVDALREFHGFGDGLPSVYRCLVQWPAYLEPAWEDLQPVLESDAYAAARERAAELVERYVAETPYSPRLAPEDMRRAGLTDDAIEDVCGLFADFNSGAVESVLPALHAWAGTLDAAGKRSLP